MVRPQVRPQVSPQVSPQASTECCQPYIILRTLPPFVLSTSKNTTTVSFTMTTQGVKRNPSSFPRSLSEVFGVRDYTDPVVITREFIELRESIKDVKTELATVKTELATVRTELATVKTELATVKTLLWILVQRSPSPSSQPASLVQHPSHSPSVHNSSTPSPVHEGHSPVPSLPGSHPPPSLPWDLPSPSVECSHHSSPVFHDPSASSDDAGPSVTQVGPAISKPSIHATEGLEAGQKQSRIGRLKKFASKVSLKSLKDRKK